MTLGILFFSVPYLSPPHRPPLGIPIKIAKRGVDDEKEERRYHCFSFLSSLERFVFLPPQSPNDTKRPMKRREVSYDQENC